MITAEQVKEETRQVLSELLSPKTYRSGSILVVSCSISRVEGRKEDTVGDERLAEAILDVLFAHAGDLFLAVQCCEHLNRALIVERELAERKGLTEVFAIPVPRAGGTFAACAYRRYKEPVLVESIAADLGLDIGLTMIGMHMKPVPKPLLLSTEQIGGARVVAARSRPRLIGGERACYRPQVKEDLRECEL